MITYDENGDEVEPVSLDEWRRAAWASVDPERVKPLLDAFNVMLDNATRITPGLINIENVCVQPMMEPTGLIFATRFNWANLEGKADE